MKSNMSTRRRFLGQAGAGSLAAAGIGAVAAPLRAAVSAAEPMKITQVDAVTFRQDLKIGGGSGNANESPEWCWVRLHTDTGLVGTGETYPWDNGQIGALKDHANQLLGRDPRDIDGLWRTLYSDIAMRNAGGADMRILSAINMAQLDLFGLATGLPLYRLLGGRTRPSVRVYNTATDYWAIDSMKMGPDTKKIARFLLDYGVTAMKVYPFRGPEKYLSNETVEAGLKWIHDIREVDSHMDIAVDCWANFDFTSAKLLAHALEPYNIMYLEDAMLNINPESYAELARSTSVPICMSETLATRYQYREFFEHKACNVAMYDVCWCGGPTEAKKIADMADAYLIPTSPHTCGGPLLYICATHLSTAVPNFLIMESNYWKYTHQFPHFVENAPKPVQGHVTPPELPGIGAGIRPEIFRNGDAIVQTVAKA